MSSAGSAKEFITLVADRRDPLLGCPVYDRIEIREVLETGTRMNQFRTGQFDIISGSRDLLDQAKAVGASVYYKPDGNMVGFYFFQTDRNDNVFHDVRVRQAAAYAIDHKLIAEAVWNGVGLKPWGCSWPPSTEISTKNPRFVKACGTPYPYDPTKARELLAAAGYPPGKGPAIRLEYNVSYPGGAGVRRGDAADDERGRLQRYRCARHAHRTQSPARRRRAHQLHPVLRLGRTLHVARGILFGLWT